MAASYESPVKIVANIASAPAVGFLGMLLMAQDTGYLYWWDGSAWTLVTAAGASNYAFKTINCDNGSDPVADSTTDTLNLVSGQGVRVSGDSSSDTVTFTPDAYALDLAGPADGPSNTTSETTIYEYTIPANSLTYVTVYHATFYINFLNNTGANQGVQLKCYYDGTKYIDYNQNSNMVSNADTRIHKLELYVKVFPGSLSNTHMIMSWEQVSVGASGTINTGYGTESQTLSMVRVGSGNFTSAALSSDRTFKITATLSAASASLSYTIGSRFVTRWTENYNGDTGA